MEEDSEFDSDAFGRDSDDFTGNEMRFSGGGKCDFHGDFLADCKSMTGSNKRTIGADIADRCHEITIYGLA